MNEYISTLKNLAHQGIESDIQIRFDNTKKAHQMTKVNSMNIYIKTIINMVSH